MILLNNGDDDQFYHHQIVSDFMGHFAADYYALQRCSDLSEQFQSRTVYIGQFSTGTDHWNWANQTITKSFETN